MAITSTHLNSHLMQKVGSSGYTVSGSTVTLPSASLTTSDLRELIRVADQSRHDVALVAGVLTLKPV